jgi:MFS family permease
MLFLNQVTGYIWTFLNCLFVIGGMIGAYSSKIVLDKLGRKKGIIFHNLFSVLASVLAFVSYFAKSPLTLLLSRTFFGIQGGMSCALIPTYINEISPANLRGQTGVFHQLFITLGILVRILKFILLKSVLVDFKSDITIFSSFIP